MRLFNRAAAIRREMSAAERIPYAAHVAPGLVSTVFGDYVQVFALKGASFETQDEAELNNFHERLNVFWRNIAVPNLGLWSHVIRRRSRADAMSAAQGAVSAFAESLAARYAARLDGEVLMCNEVYLSLVYRPAAGAATKLAARLLRRGRGGAGHLEVHDALENCEKLSQVLCASLARYEPRRLGLVRDGNVWYSEAAEFFGLLINGERQRVPLAASPLYETLATSRLMFGGETIEYRAPAMTLGGAMLGIKEYPTPSVVGMYNRLLSAAFPFVLTQSFTFLTKSAGQSLLTRQFNRMANAGDFAVSQAQELTTALDALTSNDFVMGDHHLSLQVLAELRDDDSPSQRLKRLNDRLSEARSILADTGMLVAREDLAVEAAFWAQLPGHFAFRTRKAPITSRNFAAMAPFHNYPAGRRDGNHWGESLCLLISSANSPYHFSLHASDPKDPDGGSRKDTGHTLICGPTGSGKTVFVGFMISMLSRRDVTQVIFDKDRGLEILVRALGGEYLPLRSGISTGFNPLQLPATPANVEFLKAWLYELVQPSAERDFRTLGPRAGADLEQALKGVLGLEPATRRLSRLLEFLDPTECDGPHARLAPWCESGAGDYAWVFDNPRDNIVPLLGSRPIVGFDVSEFLDHARIRTPVTLYLFHLVRQMLDGRRLVCWMDEFWRLLADRAFESFAKDGPKTWRKLNAVMCLATQSASDVLGSDISRTLIEQTPTKIFFPNPDAEHGEYTQGFGLTEREFRLLKEELEPGSRMFLVKQSHQSVVCRLDLKGFSGDLQVISGRQSALSRMQECMEHAGRDPVAWLPLFLSKAPNESI